MALAPSEEEKGEATQRSDAASRLAARRAAKAAAKAAKRGTAPLVPGAVTKKVEAARSFYQDNARLLLGGIGAGLIAAVLWITFSLQSSKQEREATDQLYTGIEAMNAPVIGPEETPPEDISIDTYPSAPARAEKALAEFQRTAKQFPDSPAARWAALGEANALLQLGKYAEAEKAYQRLIGNEEVDAFLRARASEGAGFALEAQQKYAEAAKRFEQLAEVDQGVHKPLAEYHRARMYVALGDKKKAASLLEALVKAERARPPVEGTRYEGLIADAETLLTELAVELGDPKLRADIPSSSSGTSAAGSGKTGALTQDIVDALRKQLENKQGGEGLSKDIVDALEQQVQTGDTSATTVQVPAPKGGADPQPQPGEPPVPNTPAPAEPK
jgi:tetratricopeptide (TPR) repeat protein